MSDAWRVEVDNVEELSYLSMTNRTVRASAASGSVRIDGTAGVGEEVGVDSVMIRHSVYFSVRWGRNR